MTNVTANTYALNINQCVDLALAIGRKQSVLFQGEMGIGKSTLLSILSERLPTHRPVYLDGTTMVDSADMFMVDVSERAGNNQDTTKVFTHIPHEMLGFGGDTPVILFFDEIGKMSRSAQLAALRIILEQKYGDQSLPDGSMVLATTNLSSEGVGDLLPAHGRNRLTIVQMAKPTAQEWLENFAIPAGLDPIVMAYVKDNPQVFHSFLDYEDPNENQHIFHPRANRDSFVTPRSMAAASLVAQQREFVDDATFTAALIGTVGQYTALDMSAYIALGDQMPRLQEIHEAPETATVPTSPAAICMVVYRELAVVKREHVSAWMKYMQRLPKEAQGLFVNGVRALKSDNDAVKERREAVCQNGDYQTWCLNNNYMFSGDKA